MLNPDRRRSAAVALSRYRRSALTARNNDGRSSPGNERARASEKVRAHLNGEEQRVIVVPDKLVNIVV